MWNTPRPKHGALGQGSRSSLKRLLVVARQAARKEAQRLADIEKAKLIDRAGGDNLRKEIT